MADVPFIRVPDMSGLAKVVQRKDNPAGYMHQRLSERLKAFQSTLDIETELGILVVGGMASPFHLRSIAYSDPDILIFTGIDTNGNQVQLLQHHSQMGIMLVAVKKLEETAFRMGFPTK